MTDTAIAPTDRLANLDFAAHNAEVEQVWAAFNAGKPTRVPVIVGTNSRYFVFNDAANPKRIPFRAYIEDPDTMYDQQLRFQRWSRFNLLQDAPLRLPEKWAFAPDFQNFYEAAWFGCKIHYFDDQVPDTMPDFADAPERLLDNGIPDPNSGVMAKALEYFDHFRARAEKDEFLGRPVTINAPYCTMGTDGPFTVACNLFNPDFVCETMLAEPDRFKTLMDFITQATIKRMTYWRKHFGVPVPQENFGFADDSVAMISTEHYVQHVLPHHRALCDAMGTGDRHIHLCGDSTRHFTTLQRELNIQSFDTGFPVNFAGIRKALGPKPRINGGPHIDLLLRGSYDDAYNESRRILTSGIADSGRFVLREGNNLAPFTPLANTEAMYHAAKEFGRYN